VTKKVCRGQVEVKFCVGKRAVVGSKGVGLWQNLRQKPRSGYKRVVNANIGKVVGGGVTKSEDLAKEAMQDRRRIAMR